MISWFRWERTVSREGIASRGGRLEADKYKKPLDRGGRPDAERIDQSRRSRVLTEDQRARNVRLRFITLREIILSAIINASALISQPPARRAR